MFYTKHWAFVHIPKSSGNNILARCQEQNLDTLIVPWNNSTRLSRHNPIWWWKQQVDLSNKEIYSVVRNPYSRAVSVWKHIIREGGRNPSLYDFWNYDKSKDPFLHWLGNSPNLRDQIYNFRSTITFDMMGLQKDFIDESVKVFLYESQLPDLERKIGVKFTDSYINKGTYSKDYRYYYNDDSQELVYNLFRQDFIKYGYDINL